jgi:hypothetical protein
MADLTLGGLNSWGVSIASIAFDTGDVTIEAKPDQVAVAILGTSIVALSESSTTDGLYTLERSNTTAAAGVVFIL